MNCEIAYFYHSIYSFYTQNNGTLEDENFIWWSKQKFMTLTFTLFLIYVLMWGKIKQDINYKSGCQAPALASLSTHY